jgi:hypothetical protein
MSSHPKVFILISALAFATGLSRAQGVYYDYYGAPVNQSVVNVTAFPGSGGCGGADVWTALAGNYAYGSAIWPNSYSAYQTAFVGSGIPWDWGASVQYTDPYTGSCTSISWTWHWYFYARDTNFISMGLENGWCQYYLYCPNGIGASTCGGQLTNPQEVEPDPQYGCLNYFTLTSIVFDNGSSKTCLETGSVGTMQTWARNCT